MGASLSGSKKKKKTKKGDKDDKSKGKKKAKNYGKEGTPEALRREIDDVFKEYKEDKKSIEPLYYEKIGLTALLNEEREKLLGLLAVQEKLKKEREPLMTKCWEVDADEIRRAFTKNITSDKTLLVSVMACRTKWQLIRISEIYEKKYGMSLLQQLVNDLTTFIGGIFSGRVTELCNLLTFRMLPQKERDAAFLRDFTDGYLYVDDENLTEVLTTRTNDQIRDAVEQYAEEYNRQLATIVVAKTSNKNYRELMLKLLEGNRDEDMEPFDDDTASQIAKELFEAGAGRLIGADPVPFIRVLSTINHVQYDSINVKYKDQQLLQDIGMKFSADFEKAAVALCTNKYDFLANRMDKFFRAYSSNKDGICRILGSLSRWECIEMRKCFDRKEKKRTLEMAIKSNVKDKHYQQACLLLIQGDASLVPMGSDREEGEDEAEVVKEGDRAKKQAEEAYTSKRMMERGKELVKAKKKQSKSSTYAAAMKKKKSSHRHGSDDDDEDGERHQGGMEEDKEEDEDSKQLVLGDIDIEGLDDDELPKFSWDGKGRFMDKEKLKVILKEAKDAQESIGSYRQRLEDDIMGVKESYFALIKLCYETETWHRLLKGHIKSLIDFNNRRSRSQGGSDSIHSRPGSGNNSGNNSGYESAGGTRGGRPPPPTNLLKAATAAMESKGGGGLVGSTSSRTGPSRSGGAAGGEGGKDKPSSAPAVAESALSRFRKNKDKEKDKDTSKDKGKGTDHDDDEEEDKKQKRPGADKLFGGKKSTTTETTQDKKKKKVVDSDDDDDHTTSRTKPPPSRSTTSTTKKNKSKFKGVDNDEDL